MLGVEYCTCRSEFLLLYIQYKTVSKRIYYPVGRIIADQVTAAVVSIEIIY